jgi:ribose-phosphate pyrophosphokinase
MISSVSLISGQSNPILAKRIAKKINAKVIETKIDNFSDGEIRVQVMGPIGNNVIIVQSTCPPVNDHLMELLLLADTAKRAGARNITAIVPYFGYSRQDRCTYKFGPISSSLVIKIIELSGINHLITLDLHSAQLEGMFSIPITNLNPVNVFLEEIKNMENIVVVSPDIGGISRARNFSSVLGVDLAIINKLRLPDNNCVMNEVIGEVKNKTCIMVDDIIDSGNTVCKAADLLIERGAGEVICLASHAVLSGSATSRISESKIKEVYISDSIIQSQLSDKFKIIQVDSLLSSALSSN